MIEVTNICLFILTLSVAFTELAIIFHIRLSRRFIVRTFVFVIVVFAVFIFYIEPGVEEDLYRHYMNIERMRSNSYKLSERNKFLFVWRLILYVVSRTENNGWLPVIAVLALGYCVAALVNDYIKQYHPGTGLILLYIIGVLGLIDLRLYVSGIRSFMVCVVWYYAYHFYYGNSKVKYYIILIVLTFIHPMVLIPAAGCLIYQSFLKNKSQGSILKLVAILCLILYMMQTSWLQGLLSRFNISFLANILDISASYNDREFDTSFAGWMGYIFCFAWFIICAFLCDYKQEKMSLYNAFVCMTLVLSFANGVFMQRLFPLLGVAMFPTIYKVYKKMKSSSKFIFYYGTLFIFSYKLLCGIYALLVNMKFNGQYYGDIMKTIFMR